MTILDFAKMFPGYTIQFWVDEMQDLPGFSYTGAMEAFEAGMRQRKWLIETELSSKEVTVYIRVENNIRVCKIVLKF